ncbi:hypothetical protein AHAS_Ahas02G0128400 [Arachis hypogaea]
MDNFVRYNRVYWRKIRKKAVVGGHSGQRMMLEISEVQCLPMKVSVDLGNYTCSCRLWQLTVIPYKHACAALTHQNRRAKDVSHTWLTISAYNATYQFFVQLVPSQEYWQQLDIIPILPPHYKRPIRRPTKKRDTTRDAPKVNPDPYRTKRKYGQIKCKYCLKEGHNSRSCKAKKEARAVAATAADAIAHGINSSAATTVHVPPANVAQDEDDERLVEIYWEETLEDAEAKAALDAAADEFEPSNASVRPPTVSPHTMQGASAGTTFRFAQFMPTPRSHLTPTWPVPGFRPSRPSTTMQGTTYGLSSGSSNSTPN